MHAEARKFEVITGGKQSDCWKDQPCELTLGELVGFQICLCAVTAWMQYLDGSPDIEAWHDVLEKIERELLAVLRPFPGLLKENSSPRIADRIRQAIPCLLPTYDHRDALASLNQQLIDRADELARPHLVPSGGEDAES